jgi:hypothetical protein
VKESLNEIIEPGWEGKYEFDGFGRVSSYTSNYREIWKLARWPSMTHDGESVNKMDKGWSPVTTNKRKELRVIYREGKLEVWPKEN